MYKQYSILAVIPARKGSKGIKNKNIFTINGKPLIEYTIEEAKKSKYLDEIVISTNHEEIFKVFGDNPDVTVLQRPEPLCGDTSKIIDAIIDVIQQLEEKGKQFHYVMLLQPTQPLRRVRHIDESIEYLVDNGWESLVSVNKIREHPILTRILHPDGTLENLLPQKSTVRRQDFPSYYKVNGIIYINEVSTLSDKVSLNDNTHAYVIDSKFDLDIDTPFDLELLKLYIKELDIT